VPRSNLGGTTITNVSVQIVEIPLGILEILASSIGPETGYSIDIIMVFLSPYWKIQG
jgi:hypothetical protein